ncbi:MAG: hypothetical protein NVV70_01675 [Cellulomonas sp.]|nr:hypothetical protein [Cellulomonas sp.]MCR6646904.1 hypothetical protein [Cellulomonas sp.]
MHVRETVELDGCGQAEQRQRGVEAREQCDPGRQQERETRSRADAS